MSALHPCASCARHVRAAATVCPFCGAGREARAEAAPGFPRVSRAVLFSLGASLALVAGVEAIGSTAYADTHEAVSMVPQYGAPSDYQPPPPPDPPATPVPQPDAGTAPGGDGGVRRARRCGAGADDGYDQ